MKRKQLIDAFYDHTIVTIRGMQQDIERGMCPQLAAAFALVAQQRFLAISSPGRKINFRQRHLVRLQQAIQIAINFWDQQKRNPAVGHDVAEARKAEYLDLLEELNVSTDFPFFSKESSN